MTNFLNIRESPSEKTFKFFIINPKKIGRSIDKTVLIIKFILYPKNNFDF